MAYLCLRCFHPLSATEWYDVMSIVFSYCSNFFVVVARGYHVCVGWWLVLAHYSITLYSNILVVDSTLSLTSNHCHHLCYQSVSDQRTVYTIVILSIAMMSLCDLSI